MIPRTIETFFYAGSSKTDIFEMAEGHRITVETSPVVVQRGNKRRNERLLSEEYPTVKCKQYPFRVSGYLEPIRFDFPLKRRGNSSHFPFFSASLLRIT